MMSIRSTIRMARFKVDGRFEIDAHPRETILEACERAAIFIRSDCRNGECKSCIVKARVNGESELTEVCSFSPKINSLFPLCPGLSGITA